MPQELLAVLVFLEISLFCAFGKPLQFASITVTDTTPLDLKLILSAVVAGAVLVAFIGMLVGCVCCPPHSLKSFGHQNGTTRQNINTGTYNRHVETCIRDTEFTIFPPPNPATNQPVGLPYDNEVTFEPLPEIHPRRQDNKTLPLSCPYLPAHFTYAVTKGFSIHDWFADHHKNFPRNQLQYLQEVGSGWFGQVVEGEAQNITPPQRKTKVVVKILREDASPSEHALFLREVQPYRDLNHPNIICLLSQCLESNPFLLIMEHFTMDMKEYLIQLRHDSEKLLKEGQLMSMMCDVATAVQYMHEHEFISSDLAARNCVVTSNITVKIGDYGTSIQKYKDDYYHLGSIAVPIRWCAPECLLCTETTIETRELTKEANVWSLGVLLWETLEFGKQPYIELTDEEVLQQVITEQTVKLEKPKTPCAHSKRLYEIMKICWEIVHKRPVIQKVAELLRHLYENRNLPSDSAEFEIRWNTLQPIPRNHNISSTDSSKVCMQFENDFIMNQKQDFMKDGESSFSFSEVEHSSQEISPSRGSLSTGYEVGFEPHTYISPSLQNLRGSIEDLSTFEERPFQSSENLGHLHAKTKQLGSPEKSSEHAITAQQISDAIRDLDSMLANKASLSGETSNKMFPDKNQQKDAGLIENKVPDSLVLADKDSPFSSLDYEKDSSSSKLNNLLLESPKAMADLFKLTVIDSETSSDSDSMPHQFLQENNSALTINDVKTQSNLYNEFEAVNKLDSTSEVKSSKDLITVPVKEQEHEENVQILPSTSHILSELDQQPNSLIYVEGYQPESVSSSQCLEIGSKHEETSNTSNKHNIFKDNSAFVPSGDSEKNENTKEKKHSASPNIENKNVDTESGNCDDSAEGLPLEVEAVYIEHH
ncbi:serine/threonine-protein kinase LMTK2-like isoform X2 [Limulus polyphemus]|uniref:Serine/threonine-protein kinase LMTK2-like isoform X2 n=1 Tax=Limulus polyphemus TaxID=6850 RepID=A0ABM1BDS7_LIMPO|nr:serine/threonine-protein kinase LMTK2-like isoform X2 [Limulus polyphemus]XP_013779937.1 serine/threonine-protein kinase LMTK2-like isoform X2 [Limulus polyphemus]